MCARLSIRRAGLDGLGQLRRVIDPSPGGTTSDAYRPCGDLASITDAAGNAIDGQRKLESPDNSTAGQPAVTDLGGGNYSYTLNNANAASSPFGSFQV